MTGIRLTEAHEYFAGGRRVPGVTEIIRRCAPGWRASQEHLDRGRAVHQAVALALRGKLDWSSVHQECEGRVRAILLFSKSLTPMQIETPLASERYRFAGTPDLIARAADGTLVIADWKSTVTRETEIQLAAYWLLAAENALNGPETLRGAIRAGADSKNAARAQWSAVVVQCGDDGRYKCRWFSARELKRASLVFLNMLSVSNWVNETK